MTIRKLTSRTWGDLGELRLVQPKLYQSASGRAFLLGSDPGGKGEGLFCLDKTLKIISSLDAPPRFLVLGKDVSGLPHYSLTGLPGKIDLSPATIVKVINTINEIGFSHTLAIRSSAQVEDQIEHTAAGVFRTEFHGLPLVDEDSIRSFIDKLEAVYASAYSEKAVRFWKWLGYTEIPPLSVIIQEVAGKQWEYAPRYFLPAISGIANTASRKEVKVATVLGLGPSAVGERGLGILHKFAIEEDGRGIGETRMHRGNLNLSDIYALDLESGNAANISGEVASHFFPVEYLIKLKDNFPVIQLIAAGYSQYFEKTTGHPVDIEWASRNGTDLSLVQIRPISKKATIAKPEVAPENIILNSRGVFGQVQKEYDHIIFLDFSCEVYPQEEDIRSLSRKYPRGLFIYSTRLTQVHNQAFLINVLPFTDVLIVQDYEMNHVTGTGMQHLALSCQDEKKSIIYSQDAELYDKIGKLSSLVEVSGDYSIGTITVHRPRQPLRLAADDEAGWALLYFAGEKP